MSIHWRTQGIILKKRDRGESDRVFTVFTKEFGKVHLWAVSERKITSKLRSGLETFYHSDFAFVQGKSKKTITDVELVEGYQGLREDLAKLKVALRISDTLNIFLKGEVQDLRIWKLLQDCFRILDSKDTNSGNCSSVYYYFFWNLVSFLGWKPSMEGLGASVRKTIGEFLEQSQPSAISLDSRPLHVATKQYFVRLLEEIQ